MIHRVVLTIPKEHELWAGDGDSTVKVVDLNAGAFATVCRFVRERSTRPLPARDDYSGSWQPRWGLRYQLVRSCHVAIDWLIHDWICPSLGRTVMDEFLRRHGSRLASRERELVTSWSHSYMGLYEVENVKPGVGVEVKSLTSDETLFVNDTQISKHVVRWDGLHGRVVDGERGREFSGVAMSVPRRQLEALREWIEEDRRHSGKPWPDYLKSNWPRIRRQSEELGREWIDSLRLSNSDGEEILLSKAVYVIEDRERLVAGLRSGPLLKESDEAHFSWLSASGSPEGDTVLGSISIDNNELVLETNSRQRLERGKDMLDELAGRVLRHQHDQFTTQKELKRNLREAPRKAEPRQDEIPPEVRREVITKMMERHFATWPDIALPALDGKTPRETVKTAAGRRQVAEILKDFENAEERKRLQGEPFLDVDRLRAELGLMVNQQSR